jgi:hypothetical protein
MSLNPYTLERFLERAKSDATAEELEMIIPQGFYSLEDGGSLLWTCTDRGGGVKDLKIKYTSGEQTSASNTPIAAIADIGSTLADPTFNNYGSSLYTQLPDFGSRFGISTRISERQRTRWEQSSSLPREETGIENATEGDHKESELKEELEKLRELGDNLP